MPTTDSVHAAANAAARYANIERTTAERDSGGYHVHIERKLHPGALVDVYVQITDDEEVYVRAYYHGKLIIDEHARPTPVRRPDRR
jgi:hypothetical protein